MNSKSVLNKEILINNTESLIESENQSESESEEEINLCISCGMNMGSSNPRQYCRKTYCPFEWMDSDSDTNEKKEKQTNEAAVILTSFSSNSKPENIKDKHYQQNKRINAVDFTCPENIKEKRKEVIQDKRNQRHIEQMQIQNDEYIPRECPENIKEKHRKSKKRRNAIVEEDEYIPRECPENIKEKHRKFKRRAMKDNRMAYDCRKCESVIFGSLDEYLRHQCIDEDEIGDIMIVSSFD